MNRYGKVWVYLYTFCVTRPVHLDIVPHMTTEAFIACFKQFTARQGFSCKVVSNNTENLQVGIQDHRCCDENCRGTTHFDWWFYEVVLQLWKGFMVGWIFERMIKSTKRCLRKIIGQERLIYGKPMTALLEVEVILNSRPPPYISTNVEEPLRPSRLIIGQNVLILAFYCQNETNNLDIILTNSQFPEKYLNQTLNHFWRRWRSE